MPKLPLSRRFSRIARLIPAALVLAALACSCADTYRTEEELFCRAAVADAELSQASIAVNRVKAGRFSDGDGREYPSSGTQVTNVIFQICRAYNPDVRVSDIEANSAAEFLDHFAPHTVVPDETAEYVIFASINNWVDHETAWCAKSDRIDVQIGLYRTADRTCLAFERFTGMSNWLTLGGDLPQELLAEPLKKILARWFGRPILEGKINCDADVTFSAGTASETASGTATETETASTES